MENETTKMTERQVREFLGVQADKWSDKGIKFLKLRLCGTKWRVATHNALTQYKEGTFDELVPEEVNKEVAGVFGMTKAEPERLIIIGLGRPAQKSKASGWQEKQTSLLKIDEDLINNIDKLEEKERKRLELAVAQKHASERLFAMFDPMREQREAEAKQKAEEAASKKAEAKSKLQTSKAKVGGEKGAADAVAEVVAEEATDAIIDTMTEEVAAEVIAEEMAADAVSESQTEEDVKEEAAVVEEVKQEEATPKAATGNSKSHRKNKK